MSFNTRQKIVQDDLKNCLQTLSYEISADGSSGLVAGSFPVNVRIIDVIVNCTTANADGTVTLSDGTNDITDGIACAVLDTIDKAATIDNTYSSIDANTDLTVTTNGAADRGYVTILAVVI